LFISYIYHGYVDLKDIGVTKSLYAWWPFALDGSGSVLIFFVLSGYLMTKLFDINKYNFTKSGIINFYIARINRILPLYWFVLLFIGTIGFNQFLMPKNWLGYLKALTFLQYTTKADYIVEIHRWFMVGWSLVVEMQYYLLAPLVSFVILKKLKSVKKSILLYIPIITYFLYNNNWINFGISLSDSRFQKTGVSYLPYFMAGGLMVVLLKNKKISRFFSKLTFLIPFLVLITFGIPAYHKLSPITNFSFYYGIFFVLLTCLIILIYESINYKNKPAKWDYKFLEYFNPKKWLEILGHISFSAYLIHLPIIYSIGGSITRDSFIEFNISENAFFIIRFGFTILWVTLLSSILYWTVEQFKLIKYKAK
jgi:peptidoglycan/LPS O-acetylase OafA/YrhL